jgi:asparagine synthase (glutamine-hydrolysing)
MCGIAGIIDEQGRTDGLARNRADVELMVAALAHRGPDDAGLWLDDVCALGHRRLSIIDLSQAGHQPMSNENGSVWITFNGEIYNFLELRRELESLGYRFRTRTDTEAIIFAYEQWGTECVKRLRGMFAFAIWDTNRRQLFLARDRAGKKPLFYGRFRNRFLFASELQGLLSAAGVDRVVDFGALDSYLAWGYIPAPKTAFLGIRKLPPAHWLLLRETPGGWKERVERYWSLSYEPKLKLNEAEAAEALREKLKEAVRLRMLSDVPLGAFLSGGIDSSIVVGLMAEVSNQPVKTFSIGFAEAAWDETEHAARVAARFGTNHQKFDVRPDALEILPTLVRHYGEPYADSSAVPTFYVSKLTRSEVTVALNGDGGDESFAGYERYLGNRVAERVFRVPGARLAAMAVDTMLPHGAAAKSRLRTAHRFFSAANEPMSGRYAQWIGFFDQSERSRLLNSEAREAINGSNPEGWMAELFARREGLDPVDRTMAVDIDSYLPFDLLVKVDITSMASSLEARSPFLDHEVMELAATLPVNLKLRGTQSKYLLKRAFADLLPAENVSRRKMGFGVPVGQWFRGSMKDFLRDTLLSESASRDGYLDRKVVSQKIEEHLERRAENGYPLWNLMMLELWRREFKM